ncbi:sulfatase family protein [Novipirellula sp. SH528]|uniref:sulfatase family protein n=1 Tax=Novipirellula sp. SH528 TaxID=3454466 RepID=UPI003FA05A77
MNLRITIWLVLLGAMASFASAEQPPNVVLIYADDLGYGDVGCYGATKVQTPNIDKLAAEGRRFTDAHSPSAVCTPSRYGLLTGEYPMRKNIWGPCSPTKNLLIDTNKMTIASLLKQKGYHTSCFGKWHLGFGEKIADYAKPLRPGPLELGFDYYFGVPVVNSAPPYVFVENDTVVGMTADDPIVYLGRKAGEKATPITPLTREHGARVGNWFGGAKAAHKLYNDFELGTELAKRATEWIGERGDDPFFMYLATTNIHHPFTPHPRFQGTSQCGLYGDFIHELDWIVGEVVNSLEAKGVADNTLIIFTSDNGGMFNHGGQHAFKDGHRQNGDLLGFKFGVWEGGHRIPFIAKWPGKIHPNTVSDQLISNLDMLATLAAITGQDVEPAQLADSVNILPALVTDTETPVRDHLVLLPRYATHVSVRKGKWMYIPKQGAGGFTKDPGEHAAGGAICAAYVGNVNSDFDASGKYKPDSPTAQLYDLEADVNQTRNLYTSHPEVVQQMAALLKTYRSQSKRGQP